MVIHGTGRAGSVSWRKVQTGQISHCWAIGIGLAPEFRGRGYGTEAHRLLVRYLFAHTQLNRIEATTEITNTGEQRALEKAGFTREGVLRRATFRAGRWHDQIIYSVLRHEVELLEAPEKEQALDLAVATLAQGPDVFGDPEDHHESLEDQAPERHDDNDEQWIADDQRHDAEARASLERDDGVHERAQHGQDQDQDVEHLDDLGGHERREAEVEQRAEEAL
jgi:GNAT superfamily N-acetyltransferase